MTPAQVATCRNGHPRTPENTSVKQQRGRPRHQCRPCANEASKRLKRAALFASKTDGIDTSWVTELDLAVDVWKRITIAPNGCWLWEGHIGQYGYGRTTHSRRGTRYSQVHNYVWETKHGPVPDGLELDHLCRVRACCNPDHLEPVTHRENMLRGDTFAARNRAKTHCPQGHEYAGSNLGVNQKGERWCRTCDSESKKRRYAA